MGKRLNILYIVVLTLLLWHCSVATGQAAILSDTIPQTRIGWAADVAVGKVLKIDAYERMWLRDNNAQTIGAEVRFTPSLADPFAADYGGPTLGAGLRFGRYCGVTMKKDPAPDWGQAEMVDYTSRMGNTVTAYAFFERPLLKSGRWEADYRFDIGLGWGSHPYNKKNNVDNELIGSNLLIYFGAGFHATYYVRPSLGLRAGLEFAHHSNGALNRPNKGANFFGPMLGVVVRDADDSSLTKKEGNPQQRSADNPTTREKFRSRWYTTVTLGVGGKTLLEEWLQTQYATSPDAPGYRKESFHVYHAFTAQADVMYRYARRWSSGLGIDLFYASAANRIADIDAANGYDERHSPWSVGIAAKHEVWWHRVALTMSLGVYLYRHMGFTAQDEEKPYYERIGVKYEIPHMHGLTIGGNVKAHLTKADQTELTLGIRL